MKKADKKEMKRYEKVFGDRLVYDMTPEEKEAPITKEIAETLRHRLEKRWYRRLIELNILIIVVVVTLFARNFSKNCDKLNEYTIQMQEEFAATINETGESEKEDKEDNKKEQEKDKKDELTMDDIPFEVKALGYGLLVLVIGYIALYVYYAMYRASALRITERNFPEVYETIEKYANRLGIKVPKAYVMQSSGVLNAFSTFLFRRQWIMINSELFEVAYREHHDMDALNFIIAHEMAHIYYGHATLHYNLPIWFSMRIPVIGAIASRTREYSCDRLAQRLTGVDGVEAMLVAVVDRHLYKMVDKDDYIGELKSMNGFFIWIVNLFQDHPIMQRRMLALKKGRGSGSLY